MQLALKWLLDRLLALVLLLFLLPFLLCIGAIVRFRDGAPVLHREQRLGQGGGTFTLRKFRSMVPGHGPGVAPVGDPRITPTGALMRRWRLDELPQLLNVLTGEMSLVGPRPLRPEQAEVLTDVQRQKLLSVRPGMTGPAALAFIGDDAALAETPDPEETYREILLPAKAELELAYLSHWSLGSDLMILAQTVLRTWSPAAHRRSEQAAASLLKRGRA